jgi:hypothetical protein
MLGIHLENIKKAFDVTYHDRLHRIYYYKVVCCASEYAFVVLLV